MTILQVRPRLSTFTGQELASAMQYCMIGAHDDWYVLSEAPDQSRHVVTWLHWAVDRAGLQALLDSDSSCVDFSPASGELHWICIEGVDETTEIPRDDFYLCRYILTVDP